MFHNKSQPNRSVYTRREQGRDVAKQRRAEETPLKPRVYTAEDIIRIMGAARNELRILTVDNMIPVGRCAEVLRGTFQTTNLIQFAALILNPELNYNLLQNSVKGSFGRNQYYREYYIFKDYILYDNMRGEWDDTGEGFLFSSYEKMEGQPSVLLPRFKDNLQFMNVNNFLYGETKSVMESVKMFLDSGLGNIEDIGMFGRLQSFVDLPPEQRRPDVKEKLVAQLATHKHGDAILELFQDLLR